MSSLGSVGSRDVMDWEGFADHDEVRSQAESSREAMGSEGAAGYAFRPVTVQARKALSQIKTPVFRKGRKPLTPTKTASMFTKEGHDCSSVNVDHTVSKVIARFFFSLFRFAMAHAWECKTMRGHTEYNGAVCHCGNCQAAHSAFSPALCDNQLEKVAEKVKQVGYAGLPAVEKEYLDARFVLTRKDRRLLSSKDAYIRSEHMMKVMSSLGAKKQRGSFVETPLDYARNITFEGPTASNRVDCHLELLRSLEDELAEKCRLLGTLPKEALEELFIAYQESLTRLREALSLDQNRFSFLNNCWRELIKAQEEALRSTKEDSEKFFETSEGREAFHRYVTAATSYQEAFNSRFENAHGGVPQQKSLKDALVHSQSKHVLSQIINAFNSEGIEASSITFTNNFRNLIRSSKNLEINEKVERELRKGNEEIKKRIAEVEAQLSVMTQGFEELHKVIKMYFGVKDEKGNFFTPTKEDLVKKLNEYLVAAPVNLLRDPASSCKCELSFEKDSFETFFPEEDWLEDSFFDDSFIEDPLFEDSFSEDALSDEVFDEKESFSSSSSYR